MVRPGRGSTAIRGNFLPRISGTTGRAASRNIASTNNVLLLCTTESENANHPALLQSLHRLDTEEDEAVVGECLVRCLEAL